MKCLLVVDMQNDFFKSIKNKKIFQNINKLIEKFSKKDLVIFTQEYHTMFDKEFKKAGVHCIKNTRGAEFIPGLSNRMNFLIKKKRYSAFYKTNLDKILGKHKIKELYICGISTSCCVLATAFDAFARDYEVFVIKDAVSSSKPKFHKYALQLIDYIIGKTILSKEVC